MKLGNCYKLIYIVFCFVTIFIPFNMALGAAFFSDSFESGNTYSPTTTDGSHWVDGNVSSGCSVSVSDSIKHTGNYALKFQWRSGSLSTTGGGAEQRFRFGLAKGELFMRFYIYFPNGTEPGETKYVHRDSSSSDNNKFFRIWNDNYSYGKWGATLNRGSGGISYLTARGNVDEGCTDNDNIPDLYNMVSIESATHLGRWICMEFHIKPDSGSGDGIYEFWMDGNLVDSRTDIVTSGAPCSPNSFLNGYLLGYSNSGFDNITNIYVDDVVFSDTYIGPLGVTVSQPPERPKEFLNNN